MAKQITQCGCGGSFDGTPSGRRKHTATSKHIGWVVGQQKAEKKAAKAAEQPTVGEAIVALADAALANGGVSPEAITAVAKTMDPRAVVMAAQAVSPAVERDELIDRLSDHIAEVSRERDRRVKDVAWRKAHRTLEEAEAYHSDKVIPLLGELDLLTAVRSFLERV